MRIRIPAALLLTFSLLLPMVARGQAVKGDPIYVVVDPVICAAGKTYVNKLSGATFIHRSGDAPGSCYRNNSAGVGSGDVIGPGSSVDGQIAIWNGVLGNSLRAATVSGMLKGTVGVLSLATPNVDYLTPTGDGSGLSGIGEINTMSNAVGGTGTGLIFKQKVGPELQVRRLLAGANIILTLAADDITIATTGAGGDVIGPASSVDNQIALFSGILGKTVKAATVTGLLKASGGVLSAAIANTDYQSADADLTAIGLLAPANNDILQRIAGVWTNRTPAQVKTSLVLSFPDLAGSLAAGQMPAHTGDVVTSAGSIVTTISAGVVSNAKLANVATATFKARATAGTGSSEDLNGAQATALLSVFVGDSGSGGLKGLVPAPTSGDATKCLSGASTWISCGGGGGLGDMILASIQTVTGAKTFVDGKLIVNGGDYGATDLSLPAGVEGAFARNTNAGSKHFFIYNSGAWRALLQAGIDTVAPVSGGLGADNSAANGVPVFAAGIATVTASPTLTALTATTVTTTTLSVAGASVTNNIVQNSKSTAYTTILTDAGKHIYHPSADTTARIWTIDSNANVAYPIGTAITFVNDCSAGSLTISIVSDTLILGGAGTTGSRTLAACGEATALKITATRWIISGPGLT